MSAIHLSAAHPILFVMDFGNRQAEIPEPPDAAGVPCSHRTRPS